MTHLRDEVSSTIQTKIEIHTVNNEHSLLAQIVEAQKVLLWVIEELRYLDQLKIYGGNHAQDVASVDESVVVSLILWIIIIQLSDKRHNVEAYKDGEVD